MAIRDLTARIRITADTRGVQKGMKSASRSVGTFQTDLLAATAAITAGFATASVAIAEFSEASQRAGQRVALQRQLDATGQSLDAFLAKLTEVSQGTIATAELIQQSSNALLLGIPADAIVTLLEQARVAAIATGQDVSKAFQDITLGVARQSRLILDNLGIIIKVEQANDKYAKTLGKVTKELTANERQQAFLNEVLEIGRGRVESFGDAASENALALSRFGTTITNTIDQIFDLAASSNLVADTLDSLSGNMFGNAEATKALRARYKEVNEEYEESVRLARQITAEFLKLNPLVEQQETDFDQAAGAIELYNKALKDLGVTTEQEVIDELEKVQLALEGANEAILDGKDDLGFYTRQIEELAKRERELKIELGFVVPELENLTGNSADAAIKTEELALKADQATLSLQRERVQVQGLNEDLSRLNETGVITATTFDRIAATQGEAAAVQAALASGATTFGRRINLRGGSRLVNVSLINNRAGVASVGGNFGTSRQQSRFFPNLTTVT